MGSSYSHHKHGRGEVTIRSYKRFKFHVGGSRQGGEKGTMFHEKIYFASSLV